MPPPATSSAAPVRPAPVRVLRPSVGAPRPRRAPWLVPALVVGACLAVAALSLLLPSSPTYDPWAWLTWGREVLHLDLVTTRGPSWKPLPVAVTTVLAPFGAAAPQLWLVVARAAGLLALGLAFRAAHRLAGGGGAGVVGGLAAVVGLALLSSFMWTLAYGASEPFMIAFALLAVDRHLDGRHRQAFVAAWVVGLVRTEPWPLIALYGLWLVWRDRGAWRLVLGLGALLPAAWVLPEWWGSGDPLRAAQRARHPDRTTYAVLAYPTRAAWHDVRLALVPMARLGVALALVLAAAGAVRRRARLDVLVVAAVGLVWVAIVLFEIHRGYAGMFRYFMGGLALLVVVGGAGWGLLFAAAMRLAARAGRGAVLAAAAALAAVLVAGVAGLSPGRFDELRAQARAVDDQAQSTAALPAAIARAGGAARVRACGGTMTAPLKIPLVAWYLEAHLQDVRFHSLGEPTGFVFQLRGPGSRRYGPPAPPRARVVADSARWRVLVSGCRGTRA